MGIVEVEFNEPQPDKLDPRGFTIIGVQFITATPEAERLIELLGREAYGSAASPTIEGRRQWIRKRLEGGEDDVIEPALAHWLITCSRVVSHETVRHRIASYTQRSLRFREPTLTEVIMPPEVREEDIAEWVEDYRRAFDVYAKWRKRYPRQTARYHLPMGSSTRVACSWNLRQTRHILRMRAVKAAQPEMRFVAERVRDECLARWPGVFVDWLEGSNGRAG